MPDAYQVHQIQFTDINRDEIEHIASVSGDVHFAWELEPKFQLIFITTTVVELIGYTSQELLSRRQRLPPIAEPGAISAIVTAIQQSAGERIATKLRLVDRQGDEVLVSIRARLVDYRDGRQVIEGSLRKFTELVHMLQLLQASEERYRILVENSTDFIIQTTTERIITFASPAVERMLGWTPAELVGGHMSHLIHPDDQERLAEFSQSLNAGQTLYLRARIRKRDGSYIWLGQHVKPILDDGGQVVSRVSAWRDISQELRSEESLRFMATHDSLTGVFNRREFLNQLQAALDADADGEIWLLFCDVDRLKPINDTLGHLAGDKVITSMARRLRGLVGSDDCVARIGGDEFVVLPAHPIDAEHMADFANAVIEEMRRPIHFRDQTLLVTVSVGLSSSPRQTTVDEVMARVDQALYQAKYAGGDAVVSAQAES